jgi:murein DD-endopeptidase MepM/ murein hydrolase activator NlpD
MKKKSASRDLQGCVVVLLAVFAVGAILFRNFQPNISFVPPVPVATTAPDLPAGTVVVQDNSLRPFLSGELRDGITLVPTLAPSPTYSETNPDIAAPGALLDPNQVVVAIPTIPPTRSGRPTLTPIGVTAVPSPTPLNVVARNSRPALGQWSPPPEQVPMSRDLRDHFYFRRPVDSSANSSSLSYYPYGSSGPQAEWRVHHGLDMPNPDGQPVRAAADGVVVWAADHYRWSEDGFTDAAESYGNVVIIEHNFGYNGQRLYTLYAHLSRIIVNLNDVVSVGEVVGLSGHSGNVTGPHVHFEVRLGQNFYWTTRNPLLWMAPLLDHGIVAGRVVGKDGQFVDRVVITLLADGKQFDTTMTYSRPKRVPGRNHDVDPDDNWRENFVFGDIPVGKYEVSASINGVRVTKTVEVQAGTTSFVELVQ